MYTRSRFGAVVLTLALTLGTAHAADVQELVHETQRSGSGDGYITMVWWLPHQFWEETMKANPMLNEAGRQQVLDMIGDYTVLAMMRARPSLGGLTDATPKAELLQNTRVEFNGKRVEPVPPEQVAPGAQLLLAQMKPALAAVAGQVGQNLEFVVYPGSIDGKPIDAAQPGSLSVTFFQQPFGWRLPLGSLLPKRVDRNTGEEFPGNYNFNPYTGEKLAPK